MPSNITAGTGMWMVTASPIRSCQAQGLDPLLYRGTGHDEDGNYSERPEVYHDLMMRLRRKIDGARDTLPAPLLEEEVELDVGIIHYGSMQNTIRRSTTSSKQRDGRSANAVCEPCHCTRRSRPSFVGTTPSSSSRSTGTGRCTGCSGRSYRSELVPKVHSVAYSDGFPPRAELYAQRILEVLEEVNA